MNLEVGAVIRKPGFLLEVTNIEAISFPFEKGVINTKIFFSVVHKDLEEYRERKMHLILDRTKKGTLGVDIEKPCSAPRDIQRETIKAIYVAFCMEVNKRFNEKQREEQLNNQEPIQLSVFGQ